MKNKNLLIVICTIVFTTAAASILSEDGKAGRTGSPTETTCVSCHDNTPVNTGGGSVVITSNMSNDMYVPSQTYTMTVTVSEAGKLLFGTGVEALNSGNTDAGTLVITNATETHLLTASNGRVNVVHNLNGGLVTTPGSKSFNFDWTAPATDIGYVTFYVGSVAAIGDQDPADDNTYTTSKIFSSPTTVGIKEINSDVQFSVFPNPVKDVMNIYFFNNENVTVEAGLYSITGQKVADLFNQSVSHAVIEKHIPVADSWKNGVYFLNVKHDGQISTKRILIQR
jgi:hypothetical protein